MTMVSTGSSKILRIAIIAALFFFFAVSSTTALSSNSNNNNNPNQLLSLDRLSHSYCALRHGQSLANTAQIISSDPVISTVEHGLSELGHEQVKESAQAFATTMKETMNQYCGVAIISSDFTRARETAQRFANACRQHSLPLYQGDIVFESRLRERYFGELNGGSDARYQDVWDRDLRNPHHAEFGVESVYSVVERTTMLVLDLEQELSRTTTTESSSSSPLLLLPWKCVLVAHGDVLQILQTGFRKMDGSLHRTLPHLETATVRDLELSDTGLCGYHAVS